jgi:carbon-monoxide dehydrogenase medium subunit
MYPSEFEYYRPKTLAEATELLIKHKQAKVLAGGHSLLPAMKLRMAAPTALVDIGALSQLQGIELRGGQLKIGAMTTHEAIAESEAVRQSCPILAEAARQIGDLQVRNRGTLGGSLAHADPAADQPTVITALRATLIAHGPRGERQIAAESFFVDLFTTALAAGELLTSISIPVCGRGTGGAYLKHRHPASSYAVIGIAALVELLDAKCARVSLVVGGASTKPTRATAAEQLLTGRPPEPANLESAAGQVAQALADPIGDHYASGEYRKHLAAVLARKALALAIERGHERGQVR